jgi:hypothetical protein
MEKKNKAGQDGGLSSQDLANNTLSGLNVSNEEVLKSAKNTGIQNIFNSALGTTESSMTDDNLKDDPLMSMDEEEGKATVVLDMNSLKSELEAKSQVPDVDLSFGGGDDGGLSIGSLDSEPLQMDSLESSGGSPASSDDGGGMDVDLSMGDLELTGSSPDGEPEPEAAQSAPSMDLGGGLDLSTELGELESSSGQIIEEEEEPMILNSDNNDEVVARERAGLEGDLDSSFSEPSSLINLQDSEDELQVSPPDESVSDLDFAMPELPADEEEEEKLPPVEDDILQAAPAAKAESKSKPAPVEKTQAAAKTEIQAPTLPPKQETIEENIEMKESEEAELEIPQEDLFEEIAAPVVQEEKPVVRAKTVAEPDRPSASRNAQINNDREYATHQDYVVHHDDELMKLSATIRGLRDDRQQLLDKIHKLEEEKKNSQQDNISMRAELDEKKIELTLLKKRHNDEVNHLRYQLNLTEDKRVMVEEKNKLLRQEFDKLASKVRLDFNKIQSREKELEHQLELLKADSEVQIRHRDIKVLELKRKIDTLEFDMENIIIKENQSKNIQGELEAKLDKTIKTLRNAISSLESEDDNLQKFELLKKKNLDL